MYIVTAGKAFNDIDAYGCAIAYAELLRFEGKEVKAVFIGPLNHSVTPLAIEQGGEYLAQCSPTADDRVVYVDLSDARHFAFPDLNESQIFEIYDHHYGFEDYWAPRLGERSHIERVGAAGTLIWEEFVKRGFSKSISSSSANLLALAILQNTLNFTSSETNGRDHQAFAELAQYLTMASGWQKRYFDECSKGVHEHFAETLENDTKKIEKYFGAQDFIFSQLEITEEPIAFIDQYKDEIDAFWSMFPNGRHLINIADISSKTSLLYSDDAQWLFEALRSIFPEVTRTSESWIEIPIHQRKQILKLFNANPIAHL
ncbi:MAG: hypothetical protein WC802_02000 [Patescibacteria group bacterium]|jgi:inorganic pyrophosphatase/manganese-dependent inorganic pyrophosphatase